MNIFLKKSDLFFMYLNFFGEKSYFYICSLDRRDNFGNDCTNFHVSETHICGELASCPFGEKATD